MVFLAEGQGLHIPTTDELFSWPNFVGTDKFGLNKVGLLYLLAAVLAAIFWLLASRKKALVPKGLQNVFEPLYSFIREQIVIEVMGNSPQALRYVPFLGTLFSFILFCNLFEIIPGINFPPTARMAGPAFLAILVWFIFNIQGIAKQGPIHYFGGILFPPGVPKPIYILLTPIELVSVFIVRPLTLAVRLFANMVAGNTLLAVFLAFSAFTFSQIWVNPNALIAIWPFAFAGAVGMMGFEIFVGFIQAFIFTILTAVYIGESLHGH